MSPYRALRRARQLRVLASATCWVLLVRVGLSLSSMKRVRRSFLPRRVTGVPDESVAAEVVWAVGQAARLIPHASCLTQALSAQIMLAKRGCPSVLHIGVKRQDDGEFGAHAWLDSGGTLLLGGTRSSLATFVPLAHYAADR